MVQIIYIPNPYAAAKFNIKSGVVFQGEGATRPIMKAIGEENYKRYMFAQDPLAVAHLDGKDTGEVNIVENPDDPVSQARYVPIGTIQYASP